jgi:filamentous hemagglutinin family protein
MKWPPRRLGDLTVKWSGLLLLASAHCGWAQVVLDGTLGPGGALAGPNYSVTADLGLTRGPNLFHSFTQFDLKAGDVASFSGPVGIQNILSRVTGGRSSSIDGAIRSEIAGANFFFINPRGVVFGPNASVEVSGAFAASGANYLKLADDARFVAALDADDSLLSSAPVAAFGFLNRSGGSVEVQGTLKAGPDTSLSLVGTSVSVLDGTRLEAVNGQIHLRGVGFGGEVAVPSAGSGGNPGGTGVGPGIEGGNIVIRGGALVVNNASINASATGGNIDIALTDRFELLAGGQIRTSSTDSLKGGDILIQAPSILLDGLDQETGSTIAAETFSDNPLAAGGSILFDADSVELRRGAEISVSTFGSADAGQLEINTGSLRMQGSDAAQFPTQISANAAGIIGGVGGAGGQITIQADTIEIGDGAGILAATFGDSNAGAVEMNARSITLANGALSSSTFGAGLGGEIRIRGEELTLDGPFASITALTTGLNEQKPAGDGGVIDLRVGRLRIRNDAAISANTFGDGKGGNINITADAVVLDGATFQPDSFPGITAASNPSFFGGDAGGRGGDITIEAGSLTLRNAMVISTTTETRGDGGSINIRAGAIELESRASIQSASLESGRAGTISLESARNLQLTGESTVSTSAPKSSGGDLRMQAGNEIRLEHSGVSAQAGPGGGGNITLLAPALIYLFHGTLDAQAAGDGGNLNIDPVFFILNNSALISKSTTANGGNITILSDFFFQSASLIDASAPFGLPGTVSVSAPEVDLSGSLVGLPSTMLGVESQLRPDCAVRVTDDFSSFVVLGRGGLPPQPGGFVPSGLRPSPDE